MSTALNSSEDNMPMVGDVDPVVEVVAVVLVVAEGANLVVGEEEQPTLSLT